MVERWCLAATIPNFSSGYQNRYVEIVGMIQRELERQKGNAARWVGRDRRARRLLVGGNVFRLCKPRFPLDIEMITFS
jgi:hypothetical protein